jgi:2-oxoglutarate ferredoxin oxidoreductase subunit delta
VTSVKSKKRVFVKINAELCKGCSLCVDVCKENLLKISETEINQKGYHYAIFDDSELKCICCTFCAMLCPDAAIEIDKEE